MYQGTKMAFKNALLLGFLQSAKTSNLRALLTRSENALLGNIFTSFVDFSKLKTLGQVLDLFSKIVYQRVSTGKIWRNPWFQFWKWILDIYSPLVSIWNATSGYFFSNLLLDGKFCVCWKVKSSSECLQEFVATIMVFQVVFCVLCCCQIHSYGTRQSVDCHLLHLANTPWPLEVQKYGIV